MVPISAVVDVKTTQGPALVSLYNLYPSAPINGRAARGYSSGQAIETMERALSEMVIEGIKTTIPLHLRILRHGDFRSGMIDTDNN